MQHLHDRPAGQSSCQGRCRTVTTHTYQGTSSCGLLVRRSTYRPVGVRRRRLHAGSRAIGRPAAAVCYACLPARLPQATQPTGVSASSGAPSLPFARPGAQWHTSRCMGVSLRRSPLPFSRLARRCALPALYPQPLKCSHATAPLQHASIDSLPFSWDLVEGCCPRRKMEATGSTLFPCCQFRPKFRPGYLGREEKWTKLVRHQWLDRIVSQT
jgi:hypothetical protein